MNKAWKLFSGVGKGINTSGNDTTSDNSDGKKWSSTKTPTPTTIRSVETGFMGFMSSRYDNRMERNVSLAARNLGDSVQKVVMAAKAKHTKSSSGVANNNNNNSSNNAASVDNTSSSIGSASGGAAGSDNSNKNWRIELLELLGAIPEEGKSNSKQPPSDIDVLLANSTCEKFVLRCIENELPPNLIHCLRLLRVLELQQAKANSNSIEKSEEDGIGVVDINKNNNSTELTPSEIATKKVSELLSVMCTDPTVGEQLRPHLFGLLALSGASYPQSGIHVSKAASDVIISFSKYCLSESLVLFLHDRKMIVHMTEDIKELCRMFGNSQDNKSSTISSLSLQGTDAEKVGLWSIALTTVVSLVMYSCELGSSELLKDFVNVANGYDVIKYCILYSTSSKYVKDIMKLIPMLTCCRTTAEEIMNTEEQISVQSTTKLVMNPSAFQIVSDLMREKFNPLLTELFKSTDNTDHQSLVENMNDENLYTLANFALQTAIKTRFNNTKETEENKDVNESCNNKPESLDVISEILDITLQLYSDHPNNYNILENQYHVLTLLVLSIPIMKDTDLKVFIMKTLEFVLCGVANTDDIEHIKPMKATVAVFFALCSALLENGIITIGEDKNIGEQIFTETETTKNENEKNSKGKKIIDDALFSDANLLCETIEKLLQFDNRIVPLLVGESGSILERGFNNILQLICKYSASQSEKAQSSTTATATTAVCNNYRLPPTSTPLDRIVLSVCRIFILLVSQMPPTMSIDTAVCNNTDTVAVIKFEPSPAESNLHRLLRTVVTELGEEASKAAAGVFEGHMSAFSSMEIVKNNLYFILNLLDYFSEMMKACCAPSDQSTNNGEGNEKNKTNDSVPNKDAISLILIREAVVISMLRTVLETRSLARDAFRTCGGFDTIIRLFLPLKGILAKSNIATQKENEEGNEGNNNDPFLNAFVTFLQSILYLIDATTGCRSRGGGRDGGSGSAIAGTESTEILVDPISSQLSLMSPALYNRNYLRERGFYLDLATVLASTGCLEDNDSTSLSLLRMILDVAMGHIDPQLKLSNKQSIQVINALQNPDAIRFVLGITIFIPKTKSGILLLQEVMSDLLKLCSQKTTLSQIASCGICWSISNSKEFAPILDNANCDNDEDDNNMNHLHDHYVQLIHKIASFSMSYSDFVSLLRCVLGPILRANYYVGENTQLDPRLRLPIISSSVPQKIRSVSTCFNVDDDASLPLTLLQIQENDFCKRLQSLCTIARNGNNLRVSHVHVGGDSINTISVLMHKVNIEGRLHAAARERHLKFMEIESIDASASTPGGLSAAGTASPQGSERIWTPLVSSGFSYSVWMKHSAGTENSNGNVGNIFILDISSPATFSSSPKNNNSGGLSSDNVIFMSVWYDIQYQRFNVVSSASHRNEPTCFPVSPLSPGVWHHILLTYAPPKRSMILRKSVFAIYVDGRPLEAEAKVESVNMPPNSRVIIGAPNPTFATSGIVRGVIPEWDLGSTLMLSTILLDLDATALFIFGPEFPGFFWGDRPQRLSLAATATASFSMLADNGEQESVARALRRRGLTKFESAGIISRQKGIAGNQNSQEENDSLASLKLLCTLPPECVVFGFRPATKSNKLTVESSLASRRSMASSYYVPERLINVARIDGTNEIASSDAIVHGKSSVVAPTCFADNLQWIGGPFVLMPIINAARSVRCLALALRLLRESVHRHTPNLEMMQAGGGYRMLAVLLKEKRLMHGKVLDQCVAFAVHGIYNDQSHYDASDIAEEEEQEQFDFNCPALIARSVKWVFVDLDAMKHLLLNHQVHGLRNSGPALSLRLLGFLNLLVAQQATHKAFNARRLHLLGIVRWAVHLMLDAAELYAIGRMDKISKEGSKVASHVGDWNYEEPPVEEVAVGGDPGNAFLQSCKSLLRRVLTFMLTPGDLEAVAQAVIYTVSSVSSRVNGGTSSQQQKHPNRRVDGGMLPGQVVRVYLIRLLEELIVDGVNEIVASGVERNPDGSANGAHMEQMVRPHAGGIASQNRSYLSSTTARGRRPDGTYHPKEDQVQAFLSAFARVLTPVWFASLLEGCHEQASVSAVFRLMIMMLQGSASFETDFKNCGGFAPLVLSIPGFSTCASINLSMLSMLLNVPVLHLPCFPSLDAAQLCEVFDTESEEADALSIHCDSSDPSCGIFTLVAECIGRNIQLAAVENEIGRKAKQSNDAILALLLHRHETSSVFQKFCGSSIFLEPFSQTMCLANDANEAGSGIINLLNRIITHALMNAPMAAPLVSSLFYSFPIHASSEQVALFHFSLIKLCKLAVDHAMQNGDSMSVANCVGVSSVLLDQIMVGFFPSEHKFEAITMVVSILECLREPDSYAATMLETAEHSFLARDASHLARLIVVVTLRYSRSISRDKDLQMKVLNIISINIHALLNLPSNSSGQGGRLTLANVALQLKPSPGSLLYPLWQSGSLIRCLAPWRKQTYPEVDDSDQPDRIFVVNLLVELNWLLVDDKEEVSTEAISIVISLLQERRSILSELFVAEIRSDDKLETIDVMNRGGFSALLAAHEAAIIAQNHSNSMPSASSSKPKYAAFFDWFSRNETKVQLVFENINTEAMRLFPGLAITAASPVDAVEDEQKRALLMLTSRETSDTTILGGLERAELVQRCFNYTSESHTYWKRQGFDHIASGAMQWKKLLRQLKGSCSIWEGSPCLQEHLSFSDWRKSLTSTLEKKALDSKKTDEARAVNDGEKPQSELVKRWKLDLSEGFEGQRRRLLPNYEFHGMYNIDEMADEVDPVTESTGPMEESKGIDSPSDNFLVAGSEMEATAELLKDLNLKRANVVENSDYEYDDNEANDDETPTEATETSSVSSLNDRDLITKENEEADKKKPKPNSNAVGKNAGTDIDDENQEEKGEEEEYENDSSYELITGLLQVPDWPMTSYNVRRCTGLEVRKCLLLWCREAIYVVDGFELTGSGGLDGKITRLEKEQSSYNVNLRPKDSTAINQDSNNNAGEGVTKGNLQREKSSQETSNELTYQHRSQRIAFSELYSVFRRRYQLQQIALEFYDSNKNGTLIAFDDNAEREEVLAKILLCPLPNSIFSSSYGTSINYKKFMSNFRDKIVLQWVKGKMSNFDFLMHMNSFAGRSYNDLTQYPVFPWIIADYESEEIDLDDPKTYRDLSKSMGALCDERAEQFAERYASLAAHCFGEDDPPPFHYGTHYSSAAYVLYYLMRLEPFSRLALSLQGGRFDVADRLFHDIGRSWKSASAENLQDVRELIPEFFYLPDFLTNTNNFDFGMTQKDKSVHDVSLPTWAKGDPNRFVRINRMALESDYVSANLHTWIDLIFGYKQRDEEAMKALNTFVHVTYEGEVDLDAMTDPIQRASTIAQIQNFGQTPSRLFRRPFSKRMISRVLKDEKYIDFGCLSDVASLTPPFCIVGAPQRVSIKSILSAQCKLGVTCEVDRAVGDMFLLKGQLVGVGRMCSLIIPTKKFFRFDVQNNGIRVHAASATVRHREVNKILSIHDGMHRAPISIAKASLDGHWLVTGCVDSTVRVWRFKDENRTELQATLSGHEGSQIKCLDICTEFGTIVTGCSRGRVLLWDLRTLTFIRQLRCDSDGGLGKAALSMNPAESTSLNHKNGNIVTLVGTCLKMFDINGNLLAANGPCALNRPTCAVATDCPEWMEQGIVAATGHLNGEIRMWSLNCDTKELVLRHVMPENPHKCEITALRVTGIERQDTLLVGDKSGLMSICKTIHLDTFTNQDLIEVAMELRNKVKQVGPFL